MAVIHATSSARPAGTAAASASPRSAWPSLEPRPTSANCSELFFEQPLDQSDYNVQPSWQQRYFLCDQFVQYEDEAPTILFYVGNEGRVTNAADNFGLMWQLAADWGALLVFAEHRFYGESQPINTTAPDAEDFRVLSVEQALTDYVKLIQHLRSEYGGAAAPVVAVGASYGAMLAAWLRAKHPSSVQAALASSAPLRSTLVDGQGWDPSIFWEASVVTRAASPAGGCPATCPAVTRAAFAALFNLSSSLAGREEAAAQLRLCDAALLEEGEAPLVALFLMMAYDTAAMGAVPYPSPYFTGDPEHPLPPWPMRAMCAEMDGLSPGGAPEELLGALGSAVNIVHNVTGSIECYTDEDVYSIAMQTSSAYSGGAYPYQVCNQFVPSESFFPSNGKTDMFWAAGPFNASQVAEFCAAQFGEAGPRPDFTLLPLLFGASEQDFAAGASNIVFSNGLLDPWSSGGFLSNVSASMPAVVIPEAGHHVDLYWPDPEDPPGYNAARAQIKRQLEKWIAAYRAQAAVSP